MFVRICVCVCHSVPVSSEWTLKHVSQGYSNLIVKPVVIHHALYKSQLPLEGWDPAGSLQSTAHVALMQCHAFSSPLLKMSYALKLYFNSILSQNLTPLYLVTLEIAFPDPFPSVNNDIITVVLWSDVPASGSHLLLWVII